jgi:hypothetical protein
MISFLKTFFAKTTGWLAMSSFWMVLLASGPAIATQGHAGIEGVWVHQFAHLFFLFSMLLLIYWLRQAGLVKVPGWRYIQYAALFFILWNMDTMLVHFLDEQIYGKAWWPWFPCWWSAGWLPASWWDRCPGTLRTSVRGSF